MKAPDAPPPLITLITDFGLADSYVAQMKGVILGLAPQATIVDVSHGVRPQQVRQAAFIAQTAWPVFPTTAVHVAVVDPGVGSERRGLAIEAPGGRYVGPDNGVLSAALPDEARPRSGEAAPMAVPDGWRAHAITNARYLSAPLSATFHGRDVFAPAAAHLSLGLPAAELGPPVEALLALPALRAARRSDGALVARVLHIDHFGNVITDARAEDLPQGPIVVEIAGHEVAGPVRTYAGATGLVALVGSSGYLEVALPNGDAAEALAIQIGDGAIVRPAGEAPQRSEGEVT